MTVAKQISKCPYCREPIAADAVRCRHCHSDLADHGKPQSRFYARYDTFRHGFLVGIIFTVIIFVLGYLQFFTGK